MSDIKLTELISVGTLQEIQDGFAKLTGMAALTTDETGAAVTRGSNFTEFCMEITRKSPVGCRRCEECDRSGGEKTMLTKKAVSYSCHAGLTDFAAPIMLNGEMIGSFIGGQVLTEEPDEEHFREIARDMGVDEDKYIAALRKVKIVNKQQVEAAADFLFIIANLLSKTAYDAYISKQSNAGLTSLSRTMYKKVDEASGNLNLITKRIQGVSSSFDTLEGIAAKASAEVNKTTDTLKQIQDIAMNTKILGFNASIEASRAKEAGKGFGVIAQEVRSLAETSKSSADSIQNAMGHIDEYTGDINEQIKNTRILLTQCLDEINSFSELLKEIQNVKE
ncbi:MAG: PocR ligand-binding domain-containing protein [Oscillospiraceae bacterium]